MRELRPRGVGTVARVYTASKPEQPRVWLGTHVVTAGSARGHRTYFLKLCAVTHSAETYALPHINRQPERICSLTQGAQTRSSGQLRREGLGGREPRSGGWCVCLWLASSDVAETNGRYCKQLSLLKITSITINNWIKENTFHQSLQTHRPKGTQQP